MSKCHSISYVVCVTGLASILGGILFESRSHFGQGPSFPWLFLVGAVLAGGAVYWRVRRLV